MNGASLVVPLSSFPLSLTCLIDAVTALNVTPGTCQSGLINALKLLCSFIGPLYSSAEPVVSHCHVQNLPANSVCFQRAAGAISGMGGLAPLRLFLLLF